MREIKIEDKELYELMQERNLLVLAGQALAEEGQKLEEQMQDLQKRFKKQETKQLKMVDKIRPLANKLTANLATGEFEIVRDVIIKDGELFAVIVDQVEEYKKILQAKKQPNPSTKTK